MLSRKLVQSFLHRRSAELYAVPSHEASQEDLSEYMMPARF